MKFAFSNLTCPNWTLDQTLKNLKIFGYEGFEIRLYNGNVLNPDLDKQSRETIKQACRDQGVPIVCVDTSVWMAQPDPEKRAAQIKDGMGFLEMAAEWDCPMIRVFAGPPKDTPETEALKAAIECLKPLAKRGEELGVAVALETHDAFCSSAAVNHVLNEVPGKGAGALWDILHPASVGEPIELTHDRLRSRLIHMHIKDGKKPTDGKEKWSIELLGQGEIRVQDILRKLKNSNYTGWLSVELEKKWRPEVAEPEVSLPQYIKKLKEYLANC